MDTGSISVALADSLLKWLLRKRREQAPRDLATGRYLLAYGTPYRVIVLLCGLLFLGFLVLGVALRDEPLSWALYSSIFGLATLISSYCVYEVFLVRISFSEEGILREGGPGSPLTLPWSSITRVDYSGSWNRFCFQGADGQKIRVSIYRNGLATFAEFASRRMADGPAGGAPLLLQQKALNP